jgi:hypothetical protein
VVGPYLIHDAWSPSRLPLEGTGRIQILWPVAGDRQYPRYKTQTVVPSILSSGWLEQVTRWYAE